MAVLGVSIIVAVIGIASIHVARIEVREASILSSMSRAQLAARSGMEYVLAHLDATTNWRSTYSSGNTNQLSTVINLLTGDQSFEFQLVDPDGDLDDDESDTVTLRSIGKDTDAIHVAEVTLASTGEGLDCLTAAIHGDGSLDIKEGLTVNRAVSSNGNIKITGPGVQGNAQAVGTITGTVSGNRTPGMNPPLEMPEADSVFDYYVDVGTPIYYGQLPGGKIEKVVLSASSNPYNGVTNAFGIMSSIATAERLTFSTVEFRPRWCF